MVSRWRSGASEHGGVVVAWCLLEKEATVSARLGTGFYFQFSFVILVFSALCSGSNMEMKKRISLELRNRNPAEVCNYTDFHLFISRRNW